MLFWDQGLLAKPIQFHHFYKLKDLYFILNNDNLPYARSEIRVFSPPHIIFKLVHGKI